MTLQHEFIEVPVAHLLIEADVRAKEYFDKPMNQFTMRGYGGAQAGFLGELVYSEHLVKCGIPNLIENTTKHDISFYLGGERKRLEVKSKERTVKPLETYDVSLSEYLINHQNPDYYGFVSLVSSNSRSTDINRFTSAYILGSMTPAEYITKARFIAKGEYDWSNGFTCHKDMWNVPMSELTRPKRVSNILI